MKANETMEFEIQVSLLDATKEELDSATRQLLAELSDLQVESIALNEQETAPIGSKGDPITIGSLVIAVIPAALSSVIALVQAWVMRGRSRTVKFKGKGIEFEGSPEELQKLLAYLDNRTKQKK